MQKIALLGGDQRQEFLSRELSRKGFSVVGFGNSVAPAGQNLAAALEGASAVILPVPASRDGVHLSKGEQEAPELPFAEVLDRLPAGTLLLGGALLPEWNSAAKARGILCADYYLSETVQLRNALPTAEGAIMLAMRELPVTLSGAQTAVVGYGRIGSLLAEKLIALGAKVGVLARSPEALVKAELHGAEVYRLGKGVPPFFRGARVLFNTVPERILEPYFLQTLPQNCILIELASAPGGFDPDFANAAGLRIIPAQGLPGRFYPETAGKILADAVCAILSRERLS